MIQEVEEEELEEMEMEERGGRVGGKSTRVGGWNGAG